MRRFHSKSRLGCRECKSRRVKCDERRPGCERCSQAGRTCSFLAQAPVLPSPPPSVTGGSGGGTPPAPHSVARAPHKNSRPPRPDERFSERYSLLHLQLLHHVEHGLYEDTKALHHDLDKMLRMFVELAFVTPYLMDQLLAYAAAHKSTVVDGDSARDQYLGEATRLQTRALSEYNSAAREIREDSCLPMFIFSSLLSHHVLFSVSLGAHCDLGTVLDGLTQSIAIHRGLSAIAREAWPMFSQSVQNQMMRSCHRDHLPLSRASINSRGECDTLLGRLQAADLGPASLTTLCEAVSVLQERFDAVSDEDTHSSWAACQDWLIAIPEGYVRSLEQRRPEALVILAHFAVLVHRASEHWFVRDLGRRLVHLVNDHLGQFYVDWLEWPNRAVQ
ncbi:hypothetical protein GQ53DRAFT_793773 [Thozetella sp. PMI_491]|nr:hypothetical protein GQ53DRAFT_793773 [Thozetella sp. PMI_491]